VSKEGFQPWGGGKGVDPGGKGQGDFDWEKKISKALKKSKLQRIIRGKKRVSKREKKESPG